MYIMTTPIGIVYVSESIPAIVRAYNADIPDEGLKIHHQGLYALKLAKERNVQGQPTLYPRGGAFAHR